MTWARKAMSEIFLVGAGNAQKAQVGAEAEAGQQLLLHQHPRLGIKLRAEVVVNAIGSLAAVVPVHLQTAAGGESLGVSDVGLSRIHFVDGNALHLEVGQLLRGVVDVSRDEEVGIVAGDRGSGTQRRGDDARGASARTARAAGSAAGSGAASADPDAAATATGRTRDDAGIHAAHLAAGLGALNVGLRNGQVVTRNHHVEIVLKRQVDGVAQREIDFAVAHQRTEPRGVSHAGRRYDQAAIRIDGIARRTQQLLKRNVALRSRLGSGRLRLNRNGRSR